ncbi:hypothetical protein ACSLPA_23365 [Escherichia coli]
MNFYSFQAAASDRGRVA